MLRLLVAYVHAWAGGSFCSVRLGFCRLGGCASRFQGVMGEGGGWLGQLFGVGLPSLWCPFGAGGFKFPVAICAGGPPPAGSGRCVRFYLAPLLYRRACGGL